MRIKRRAKQPLQIHGTIAEFAIYPLRLTKVSPYFGRLAFGFSGFSTLPNLGRCAQTHYLHLPPMLLPCRTALANRRRIDRAYRRYPKRRLP
jgi:hypothetical protein